MWHILKIRSNDASYIQQELSLFGIKTYYPMLKHSTDPSKWRLKPLFNGYMFIQIIDLEESSSILNRVNGIIDFLRTDGMPAEIPDDFMDQLQNKVNEINQQEGVWRTYHVGEKVLLESYGLSTVGTVVQHSMSDKTRVRILIDFMGKEIKAEVSWFNLAPFESANNTIKTNTRRTRGRNRPIKTYTTV
ncbi:MAG: transcription termination/antitermination protein NusG [Dehalococcoidia bacterium]